MKDRGPQADGHEGRSPLSGHGNIVGHPFEGAARNRSTRAFPGHRGEFHVTNCEAPSPHVPELGAREAHRASPTGLPLVPRLSSNMQLMVLKMPKLQQPEAQVFKFSISGFYRTCKAHAKRTRGFVLFASKVIFFGRLLF